MRKISEAMKRRLLLSGSLLRRVSGRNIFLQGAIFFSDK